MDSDLLFPVCNESIHDGIPFKFEALVCRDLSNILSRYEQIWHEDRTKLTSLDLAEVPTGPKKRSTGQVLQRIIQVGMY